MSSKNYLLDDRIHEYILASSLHEPEILTRLREETASHPMARMQIAPEQGQFFQMLVKMTGARKTVEVGVFTGYSSLSVALALPPDGKIVACDISEEYTSVARRYWREAGVSDKVDLRIGPAAATLRKLLDDGNAGSFDFAFIDADKTGYADYFELTYQLLRTGGVAAIDNVLQNGRVIDSAGNDKDTIAIREFNDALNEDPRVLVSMLPVADGITLALKL